MSDRNSVKAARQYARKSLELMTQHKVPPNPMNFAIWYGYAAESNRALKTELDRLLRGGAEFNPALNDELFSKHFGLDEDDDISETTERIEGAVSEVLSYIESAGRDTSGYGEQVAKLSGVLMRPRPRKGSSRWYRASFARPRKSSPRPERSPRA